MEWLIFVEFAYKVIKLGLLTVFVVDRYLIVYLLKYHDNWMD